MRRSTFYTPRTRTWRWAKSRCSWKARTRRLPAPADQPGIRRRQADLPVRRHVRGVAQGAHLVPRPPAGDARAARLGQPSLSPPLSRTRGAHHRGQVLSQERPGTLLLLLVVATRGDPARILGITPTHLYGAAPVPRPLLPAPAARDGVHTFLRTQGVTAVTRVHLVRLPPAPPDHPRGPRALCPAADWELWRDSLAAWLPRLSSQCQWMATGPRPYGADAAAGPFPPPALPPAEHCTALPTARNRCTGR